jgi:hypothetical protein
MFKQTELRVAGENQAGSHKTCVWAPVLPFTSDIAQTISVLNHVSLSSVPREKSAHVTCLVTLWNST